MTRAGQEVGKAVSPRALESAARLHARALRENTAGRPGRAVPLLRRALDLLPDPETSDSSDTVVALAARIWLSRATSESELSGPAAGLAALSVADRFINRLERPDLDLMAHLGRGFMMLRDGRPDDGIAELDRAVDLITHADDHTACSLLLTRGTTLLMRGRLIAARSDFTRAALRAHDGGLTAFELEATHNLGYTEYMAGNLAVALATMRDAADLDADVSRAVILLDRSRVLLEAGLHREADKALQEAGELFRADRMYADLAQVELARAECALVAGDRHTARRLAEQARRRFERRGNARWRRTAELLMLQADVASGKAGRRVASRAVGLAEEFAAHRAPESERTARMLGVEALLAAGLVGDATESAAGIRPTRTSDRLPSRLHTRAVKAKLRIAQGRPDLARREIRSGLVELAAHRARFGSIDVQAAGSVYGRDLGLLDLELALTDGPATGILEAVERSRAASARMASVAAPADADWAAMLAELRQLIEDNRSMPEATEERGRVRSRILMLQGRLRARAWETGGSGLATGAASAVDVARKMTDRGVPLLVYLAEADDRLMAVRLCSDGSSELIDLGSAREASELLARVRADLDVLARGSLPAPIEQAVLTSFGRSTAALDDQIVRPLRLGDMPLLVVPTGALATVPWNSLPGLKGLPITVAPSASAWIAAGEARVRTAPFAVSVVSGPDLLRAEDEVEDVLSQWQGLASRREPTRDALVSALRTSTIVHVAAHGGHQPENPLFSWIRMSDGPVFGYEIDSTRVAEHVVLSACELGQVSLRSGDDALGLSRALLQWGTASVIAGVASVRDDAAAEVMSRYHRLLGSGIDSAQALAESLLTESRIPVPFVNFGAAWSAGPAVHR